MNLPVTVKKYLNKFSTNDWKSSENIAGLFEAVVVIPAIAEYKNLNRLLNSLKLNDKSSLQKTLFIFVINNRAGDSDETKQDNYKSIDFLLRESQTGKINIGIIDASSPGNELPEKEGGVGLARKIGMDSALTKFDYSSKNKKILVCLDADCTVEENYLEEIINHYRENNTSAAYVNFRHKIEGTPEEQNAIVNYEIFLRYYVLGLQFANSPYAFHTIGSTISCDHENYIKVQGMNKRQAAEDFYFIEKLAKITGIQKINSTTIYPSGRGSWRVPFGTGQRVNRFLSKERNEYFLYSPESFAILRKWIQLFLANNNLSSDDYFDEAVKIDPRLSKFLELQNFKTNWDKIRKNSSSELQVQHQKKLWFDGFRTLKLIHFLRDNGFPDQNMFDALEKMFEYAEIKINFDRKEKIPSLELQIKYLEKLREIA